MQGFLKQLDVSCFVQWLLKRKPNQTKKRKRDTHFNKVAEYHYGVIIREQAKRRAFIS